MVTNNIFICKIGRIYTPISSLSPQFTYLLSVLGKLGHMRALVAAKRQRCDGQIPDYEYKMPRTSFFFSRFNHKPRMELTLMRYCTHGLRRPTLMLAALAAFFWSIPGAFAGESNLVLPDRAAFSNISLLHHMING